MKLDGVESHGKYCSIEPTVYGPILICSKIPLMAVFAVAVHVQNCQILGLQQCTVIAVDGNYNGDKAE